MNIFSFFLLFFFIMPLFGATLSALEFKEQSGHTSIQLQLDARPEIKVFTLDNPDRLVLDFNQTHLNFRPQPPANSPSIQGVRNGWPKPQLLRLVFELKPGVKLLPARLWQPLSSGGYLFSLNLSTQPGVKRPEPKEKKPEEKKLEPKEKKPEPRKPEPRKPEPRKPEPRKPEPKEISQKNLSQALAVEIPKALKRKREIIIVLDPGHGGKDPGAIGPKKVLEKRVTLSIAMKLKELIDKEEGMKAVLTRQGDYYLGLRERLRMARNYGADVFISIHADAFINQNLSGASVFALSPRGATSEAARWLAEKENYSELGGVNLRGLDDESGLIRTVLIDLSQTATIGASLHLGEKVLQELAVMTPLHSHKVEQARFMVLKSPDIPSVLIETGFISNPVEERNLSSNNYQQRLSSTIFQGLKRYFLQHPPLGLQVHALAHPQSHLVERGDSLSKIAARYHLSQTALKNLNHLSDDQVKVGQRLVLPLASS